VLFRSGGMGLRPLTGYFLEVSAIPVDRGSRLRHGAVVPARVALVFHQLVKRPMLQGDRFAQNSVFRILAA
jgi:hypothetical protein